MIVSVSPDFSGVTSFQWAGIFSFFDDAFVNALGIGALLFVGAGFEACAWLLLELLGELAFGDRTSPTDWRLSSSRTPSTSIVA
jgi:hypothetical protein